MQSNLDSYKILGVDPGTNILGYAILEITGKQVKILTFGVIKLFKEEDQAQKLKEIFLQVQEIITGIEDSQAKEREEWNVFFHGCIFLEFHIDTKGDRAGLRVGTIIDAELCSTSAKGIHFRIKATVACKG